MGPFQHVSVNSIRCAFLSFGGDGATTGFHQGRDGLISRMAEYYGGRATTGYARRRVHERAISNDTVQVLDAFHKGLSEGGFVNRRNVSIDYRWAHGDYGRLPALAAELVQGRVNVLVATGGDASARAARDATSIQSRPGSSKASTVRVVTSLDRLF